MDKMPNAEKFKQHLNIETRFSGAQYNLNYAKKTLLECDLEQLGIAAQKCISKYTKFNEELGNVQSNLTQKIEKLTELVNNYFSLAKELRDLKQQKFLKEQYIGIAPVNEYKEIKPLEVDQIKEIVARFEETRKIQEELSKEFNSKATKKDYEFLF